jgi:ATP-dependent Clp protease ATP-binding subunit ClpB
MQAEWESLKKSRDSIQKLRDEIASLELKAEEMTYNSEYSKVAELRYSKIPEKKKQLETLESDAKMDQTVRSDDIAKIVEKWTGIPVGKLLEKEGKIYMHLEESLGEYVIGQNEAIQKISHALRRSKA